MDPTRSDAPTASGAAARLGYQPGLDGLRAVAVGTVLLFHGGVAWMSGGFLGVDVFFVLSGFLITSILVAEHQREGRIDLRRFYGRRFRRLLPAMLLVLLAVIVYAATLAPAGQVASIRGDVLATLGYVANWRLVANDVGYFAMFTAPSPLTHVWSLAVEEQWYLVWPLVVFGLLHLARGRSLRPVIAVTAVLAVASTLWMAHLFHPGDDPSRVYYGTDTRAQELLVGALLALVCAQAGRFTLRGWARRLVSGAGLVAFGWILWSCTQVDDRTSWLYEGGMLALSGAVTLVILAVVQRRSLLRTVLSWTPLRLIGLVSYGLYLWHWPVYVVLDHERTGLSDPALLVVRLAVTGTISIASYVLVERPIRDGRWPAPALRIGAPAVALAVVVAAFVFVNGTAASPATPEGAVAFGRTVERRTDGPHDATPRLLAARVLLVGDSVAWSLGQGMVAAQPPDVTVSGRTGTGCTLFPGQALKPDGLVLEAPGSECPDYRASRERAIQELDPDVVVVLSSAWETFDRLADGTRLRFATPAHDEWFAQGVDAVIAELSSRGARVVFLTGACNRGVPAATFGDDDPLYNEQARVEHVDRLYAEAVARHPQQAAMLPFGEFECPGGQYLESRDGQPTRTDGVHLSEPEARTAARWLFPQLVDLVPVGRMLTTAG